MNDDHNVWSLRWLLLFALLLTPPQVLPAQKTVGAKIPEFHPRVVKVDLLSGKTIREPGASYQCHLSGGKHTCIEKDIEIVPLQKIVTVLPEDTFGISKILSDYRVETTFQALGDLSTKVGISHYYSTTTLKAKLLTLIEKGKIARETRATLNAAKATIEATCRAG
jgi:hypothetical protein